MVGGLRDEKKRRPRDEYIRTILSPNSWGGAIELTILAAHYGTEIASIDVETGRIDRFSPDDADAGAGAGGSESRVLLVYSGIHYDAAVLAPTPDAPQEFCASVVPVSATEGGRVLEALGALATKLRAKRAYTNTATFDLKCEVRVFTPHLLVILRDCFVDRWVLVLVATRCVGRDLRARRRRARMRRRRGMPSLANTETGYPSIRTELCILYSDCCTNSLGPIYSGRKRNISQRTSRLCFVWNGLPAQVVLHFVHLLVFLTVLLWAYPLICVGFDELVE